MEFPYGKVPLAMLIVSLLSGLFLLISGRESTRERPDLVLAIFARQHAVAYVPAIAEFEKEYGVRVQLQVVSARALQSRLQASLQVGAEVPDMVELLDGTMGTFTKGPLEDVGFLDLTDRLKNEGLWHKIVESRYTKWSSRGRLFAIPHDVHPVMLVYRKDLVDELGIDVSQLTTWDAFTRVGREKVVKDLDGDGVADRYMLDLQSSGGDLRTLILQRGGGLFDPEGNVRFDDEISAQTIVWYIKQLEGADRIAYTAGWGQTLASAMKDGLVLFYFCPDWRVKQFMIDIPSMSGKLGLMPLPAWEEGGRRTSTWGGTGLAITKQCKNPDLAWKLAMHLYYQPDRLGKLYRNSYILPPLKSAWQEPEFSIREPFFGNIPMGETFAALGNEIPAETVSPFTAQASAKLQEVFANAREYYRTHGDEGLLNFVREDLKRTADSVRRMIDRNRFIKTTEARP